MTDSNSTILRLSFATEHVLGRDVMAMERAYWTTLVRSDGTPTLLNEAPNPIESVMNAAMVIAVAASGICNPDPGFDIARYDPKDEPHIFNIDHYTVIENLASHPEFLKVCSIAGMQPSIELTSYLSEYIFVVKNTPSQTPDHWSQELPYRINIARHKDT